MTSKNSRYLTVKCWIFRRTFYFVVLLLLSPSCCVWNRLFWNSNVL